MIITDSDDDGHDDEDDDDDDDDDDDHIFSEQKLKRIHWKTELMEPFTYMVMCKDIWTRRQTLLLFICLCLCVYDILRLTAVKRTSMRNALVPGPGRGNFPREILIETIAETGVKQNIVERSSEIH